MARRDRETALLAGGLFALLLLPLIFTALDEPYYLSIATRVVIYALAAASLDLILGYGGLVSFGHAAFFGIAAYVTAVFSHEAAMGGAVMTWPVALEGANDALVLWPAATAAAGLLALAVGAVSLRTSGIYFIMITLAFAQMLYFLVQSIPGYGGDGVMMMGRNALPGLSLADGLAFYYLCLALLLAYLAFTYRLVRSRFGMVLEGSRQNERRMRALGYPVYRYRLAAFVIAGLGGGLAGVLLANQAQFVSPELLHWSKSGEILVMVVLGGLGTLFGPVLGAAALLLLEEVLAAYTEHWMLILGPILLAVVLAGRGGLYALLAGRER